MAGNNRENNFYNPFQEVNHEMKLLNHEMSNLSVQEYTDKFKELAQLMPQEISPGLMLTRFVQGLAPQSDEGQEVRAEGETYQSDLPKAGVQPQTTEELWVHEAEVRSWEGEECRSRMTN
ncbi:hypothetical protein L1987_32536 [Smallanthus sonchifolius]|uniref:Uncharacterized protein n=1 Tax=Smallanthus sonchifolius TaxID=185202 RepID=A0ACB9HNI2_9ASTR|nr:hypothetical protein L1987_32536 [Smallanthus sonchifolius]